MSEINERPIIFCTESIRAILAGQKTQARRVIKPQPVGSGPGGAPMRIVAAYRLGSGWDFQSADGATQAILSCPYGQVGDRLWVREAHAPARLYRRGEPLIHGEEILYKASDDLLPLKHRYVGFWRSPLWMPRWASRLSSEITGIRVERVQEISDEDCKAEGVTPEVVAIGGPNEGIWEPSCGAATQSSYYHPFRRAWDSLNAKRGYGWDVNPWVWVIEFPPLFGNRE